LQFQTDDKACPTPEPFRSRIGIILFLSSLFFLAFIGRFIFAPLMPALEEDLKLTHGQAGSLFLFTSLGFFLAQVGSGFISSRLTHRGTIMLSALAVGATLLCFSVPLFSSLGPLRVLMLILGAAAGLHMPSALATITAMVSRQDWGKALSVHQSAPSLALVLAPFLCVTLLGLLSWQVLVICLGGFSLAVGILFVFFGRCGNFPGEPPRPDVLRVVFAQRSFWIMVALFSMAIGGSIGTYTMLPLYLIKERGLNPDWANALLGLSRVSGLFMTYFSGWVSDRIGEKKAISVVLVSSGIATILVGLAPGPWLAGIIFAQAALVVCFFPPGFAALSRIVAPNLRSLNASLTTPIAFLVGGGIVPAFIGYMGEVSGFSAGIVAVGCFMLIAPFLIKFLILREGDEDGC
jgi:NNP family nitrate/nitrite transporter-like MFS transporter